MPVPKKQFKWLVSFKLLSALAVLLGAAVLVGCAKSGPSLESRLEQVNRGYDEAEYMSATVKLEEELISEAQKNIDPFLSAFESKNPVARCGAVWILGFSRNPKAAPAIAQSFRDRDLYVRGIGTLAAQTYVRENKTDQAGVKQILTAAADFLSQGPRSGETYAASLLAENYTAVSGRGLSGFLRKYGFTSYVSDKALDRLKSTPAEAATIDKLSRYYLETGQRIRTKKQGSGSKSAR